MYEMELNWENFNTKLPDLFHIGFITEDFLVMVCRSGYIGDNFCRGDSRVC